MMSEGKITANFDQARASNPEVSAWVSANAGSGKTHVLVNRVIRLMLTGTSPEKILCLTYTRAAAAEMSNRLYERLAEWIPLDDEALIDKIHENTGHGKFKPAELAAPRQLFARALETPGGLKIQTIHAFCEQLLHRFPLEAGVTAGFKVMDDRTADDLVQLVQNNFLQTVMNQSNSGHQDHLEEIIKYAGGSDGFSGLLKSLLDKRDELRPVYDSLEDAYTRLAKAMGLKGDETPESMAKEANTGFHREEMIQIVAVIQANATAETDQKQCVLIEQALQEKNPQKVFSILRDLTLMKSGKIKANSRLCSANFAKANPDVLEVLSRQGERILEIIDKQKSIGVLRATNALLHVGKELTDQYDEEKKRLGYYDYHDLISKVLVMFEQMPSAAWVLYKLDGGLDHILIDEAQDTSPAQWDIIQFLADEFFTGQNARTDVFRSIFAVGDPKQSIYSFQGAAPKSFEERRRYFQQRIDQTGEQLEDVHFQVSFRTSDVVLDTVDQVFSQPVAAKGVDNTVHTGVRGEQAGVVELWPMEEKDVGENPSVWVPASGEMPDVAPRLRLARKIAQKIRSWLDDGEWLESENRPVQPQDILILLRTRTQLMDALVRALKLAEVPVAGVDRLKLTEHIGVQDLIALANFVLLPQDDLNFAGMLKSSLLMRDDERPFDDDDLIFIAAERDNVSVWRAFQQRVEKGAPYGQAFDFLTKWKSMAGEMLPFEFFSSVLSNDRRRTAILTRLGSEAGEPLAVFLQQVQEFERTNIPTLAGFVGWLQASDVEIKRDMEQSGGQVRIMTVHGAKGLESKIVIVPDTCSVPDGSKAPAILALDDNTPVWKLKTELANQQLGALKARHLEETLEEYNRLLYVAMTRPRDRLYIGGALMDKKLKPNSWYQLVANVVQRDEFATEDKTFGTVWRIEEHRVTEPENASHAAELSTAADEPPAWMFKKAGTVDRTVKKIAPSRMARTGEIKPVTDVSLSPLASAKKNLFQRGNLIHKLLEYLPDIGKDKRSDAGAQFLKFQAGELSSDERESILLEVLQIVSDDAFAKVFAPDSLAEVAISARITGEDGKQILLAGKIDRLCVSDNEIMIIDYKTNRPPPASIEGVPDQYIAQMAAYRRALLEIYPDHVVRAGLLWTHHAVLMEIPQNHLIDAI